MHIPGTEVQPGWSCFYMWWLFCLQSRQGLPQWILSNFHQAPPLTHPTAAFKGLNEHQRQPCDFAFLSEHYNLWRFPLSMKSPAPLIPSAIFNDFPKTHSGFSGTVHHSGGDSQVRNTKASFLVSFCSYSSWCTCTSHGQGEGGVNQEAESQSIR